MKKILYHISLMTLVLVLIPLLIVRGCRIGNDNNVTFRSDDTLKLKVYLHLQKKVAEMTMGDYLKGVVAAEMPAEFEVEALKAQAVAARTYAYSKLNSKEELHYGADICTDFAHCQAWTAKEDAVKQWGMLTSVKYWSKISKAVDNTKNIVITYGSGMIDSPVFHSNSGGRTENAEEVWNNSRPYLRSVESIGEDSSPEFQSTVFIKGKEFIEKLKNEYSDIKLNEKDAMKDIKILDYSEGGRVKNIKIGNITLKGTDFRRIFLLRSTNFKVERDGESGIKVTTTGNGHGVGMSQWGANYLAKNGGTYGEILKYYYKGINLDTVNLIKK